LDKKIKEGLIADSLRLVSLDPNIESKSRLFPSTNTNSTTSSNSSIASASVRKSRPRPLQQPSCPSPSPSVEPSRESLLEPNDTINIASAAELPILQNDEEREKGKSKETLDNETVKRLLSTYHKSYPESLLAQIRKREDDRGLGGFERIFPPRDPRKLAQYLNCIEAVDEFFGDNLASKRRKE
jgi:hypothetical protein